MSREEEHEQRDWEQEINQIAQSELNEPADPKMRRQVVERIRNWIVASDQFRGRTDEKFILQFLRVAKYNEEKAKKRIKRNYKFRYNENIWFRRTEETEQRVIEYISKGSAYYMDFRGGASENFFVCKAGAVDPKRHNTEQMAAVVAQFGDAALEDARLQVHGCVLILCLKDVGFDFISQLTPLFLWRQVQCWQNVLPTRLKGIHLINASPILCDIIRCVKAMLSKKNRDRFFVHKTNSSTLLDIIEPKLLTDELGGTCGPSKPLSDAMLQIFATGKDNYNRNLEFTWIKP